MIEEPVYRLKAMLDRKHLVVGPLIAVVAVGLALAVFLLRTPTVTIEIGEPNERVGVTRFAEGRVDIRSGPGLEGEVINFLSPAQGALVGEPDARGWAAVLDPLGDTIGFVDAASMSDYPPRRRDRFFELEGLVVPVR